MLRFLRMAGTKVALGFCSRVAECRHAGPGVGHPVSPSGISLETTGAPTFLGNPPVPMPCSPTPAGPIAPDPTRCGDAAPAKIKTKAPTTHSFRGSITRLRHSLPTLRREGRPSTTQDSLPAAGQALPGRFGYPQGSDKRFRGVSYISSSFSKLSWRKIFGGTSPVSNGACLRFPKTPILEPSGETESGSAHDAT